MIDNFDPTMNTRNNFDLDRLEIRALFIFASNWERAGIKKEKESSISGGK